MPVLSNAKQEKFAQELAKGTSATEAYVIAGYKDNDGNAATLKGKQRIADRVAEILGKASKRAELTVASVIESLLRIASTAEALGEASGLSVARAAVMDAAKVGGLIIDRKEVGLPGEFDDLDAGQRQSAIAALNEAIASHAKQVDGPGPEGPVKPISSLH